MAVKDYQDGYRYIGVEFFPVDEGGNVTVGAVPHSADVRQDGTFEVVGPEGKGIPAGRYRVAVYSFGETEEGVDDLWNDKFGRETSPFTFNVDGTQEIVIDIAQKEG